MLVISFLFLSKIILMDIEMNVEEGGWIVIDLLQLIRSCKMHCCYAPPNPGHPAPTAAKDDLHRLHMNFVLFFFKDASISQMLFSGKHHRLFLQ